MDQRHFKKDVIIILKSIDKSQPTAGPSAFRPGPAARPQTLQLVVKKPKSPRAHTGAIPKTNKLQSRKGPEGVRHPLGLHNAGPAVQGAQARRISPQQFVDKENQPSGSHPSPNLSAMLNNIVFTPNCAAGTGPSNVTPTADFSALIGQIQFTPDVVNHQTHILNETPKSHLNAIATYSEMNTPQESNAACGAAFNPSLCSTTHRIPTPNIDLDPSLLRRKLFEGEQQTFELATDQKFHFKLSPDNRPPITSPLVVSPRVVLFTAPTSPRPASRGSVTASPSRIGLSIISEETVVDRNATHHQKTFVVEVNTSQNSSSGTITSIATEASCSGTPLRKKYASMRNLAPVSSSSHQMLRNNQGSMPNLNDIQEVRPIESNRYFYQDHEMAQSNRDLRQVPRSLCSSASSMASTAQSVHDINFSENEILAESSRFNLNRCHESGAGNIGVTYRLDYTPSLETIPQINPGATFAIPQTSNVRRGLNVTHNRVQPSLQTTSPTPPRNAQSKRIRSQTFNSAESTSSNQSISRRSFKHSPPKRSRHSRNQSETSDDSSMASSLFFQPASPLRATKSTSSLAKGETNRVRNWNYKKHAQSSSDLALKQQRDKRVTLFDAEMHIQGKNLCE